MARKRKSFPIIFMCCMIFLLAIIAVFLFYEISQQNHYEDQISLGDKYLAQMDYENASIAYQEAIRIDNKKAKGYVQLSDVYARQHEYDKALDILDLAASRITKSEQLRRIENQETSIMEEKQSYIQQQGDVSEAQTMENPESETEEAVDYRRDYSFVTMGDWAYYMNSSGLTIYKYDGDETVNRLTYPDVDGLYIMAVKNGLYYGAGHSLLFFENDTGETFTVYSGSGSPSPLAKTSTYLYFQEESREGNDDPQILQMNLTTGELKRFAPVEFCDHSDFASIGERIFFTVGVADVGSSGLMEMDPEDGSVTVIAENSRSELITKDQTLYYEELDRSGVVYEIPRSMIAWDLETDERQVLAYGIAKELGTIRCFSDTSVYTQGNEEIKRMYNGQEILIDTGSGGDVACLGAIGERMYFSVNEILYEYNETDGNQSVTGIGKSEGEFYELVSEGYVYISGDSGIRRVKIE